MINPLADQEINDIINRVDPLPDEDLEETVCLPAIRIDTITYEDCASQQQPPISFKHIAIILAVIILASMAAGAFLVWLLPR